MDTLHLILFSRAPVAGRTKTRLAAALGAQRALEFHLACLHDLVGVLETVRGGPPGVSRAGGPPAVVCHLFIAPPGTEADFRAGGIEIPNIWNVHPQQGKTLGGRMAHAFEAVLGAEGEAPRGAILVGSDLPLLTADLLGDAARALDSADVVLGPTPDGGYYLIGMRRPAPEVFELEGWGGRDVLPATLAAARAAGLAAATVAPLPDVDEAADLAAVASHPAFSALAGRRAIAVVKSLLAGGTPGAASPGQAGTPS